MKMSVMLCLVVCGIVLGSNDLTHANPTTPIYNNGTSVQECVRIAHRQEVAFFVGDVYKTDDPRFNAEIIVSQRLGSTVMTNFQNANNLERQCTQHPIRVSGAYIVRFNDLEHQQQFVVKGVANRTLIEVDPETAETIALRPQTQAKVIPAATVTNNPKVKVTNAPVQIVSNNKSVLGKPVLKESGKGATSVCVRVMHYNNTRPNWYMGKLYKSKRSGFSGEVMIDKDLGAEGISKQFDELENLCMAPELSGSHYVKNIAFVEGRYGVHKDSSIDSYGPVTIDEPWITIYAQ